MSIIGFLGRARSGKDTAADYLVEHHGYTKISFATPIKEICKILFGFNDEQLYGEHKEDDDPNWKVSPRRVMQFIGTDMFRKNMSELLPDIGENFWVHCAKVKFQKEIEKNSNFKCVISDVRFQNEIEMINDLGGIVIKLQRDAADNRDSKYTEHESEKNIDKLIDFGECIKNNGSLEDFYARLIDIYSTKKIKL